VKAVSRRRQYFLCVPLLLERSGVRDEQKLKSQSPAPKRGDYGKRARVVAGSIHHKSWGLKPVRGQRRTHGIDRCTGKDHGE